VIVATATGLLVVPTLMKSSAPPSSAVAEASTPADLPVPSVRSSVLESLPAVRYDAVIAGLLPFAGDASTVVGAYRIGSDAPVFGTDRTEPVAKLTAKDFAGAPTTVVVVAQTGPWSLVLTSARVALPSKTGGNAPAQSAGWVPTRLLHRVGDLPDVIQISVSKQTLTILQEGKPVAQFAVGVGTAGTPTPTKVTGYLQQRYLDPRQDETVFPIQLTSLHATTKDEPYGGNDGGLIGIHYNPVNAGAVSHGCVRLGEDAIRAVDKLPLGTPITITD